MLVEAYTAIPANRKAEYDRIKGADARNRFFRSWAEERGNAAKNSGIVHLGFISQAHASPTH